MRLFVLIGFLFSMSVPVSAAPDVTLLVDNTGNIFFDDQKNNAVKTFKEGFAKFVNKEGKITMDGPYDIGDAAAKASNQKLFLILKIRRGGDRLHPGEDTYLEGLIQDFVSHSSAKSVIVATIQNNGSTSAPMNFRDLKKKISSGVNIGSELTKILPVFYTKSTGAFFNDRMQNEENYGKLESALELVEAGS